MQQVRDALRAVDTAHDPERPYQALLALGPEAVPALYEIVRHERDGASWAARAIFELDAARAYALDLHRGAHWHPIY
ncbi:MAG TPA: hypothetical protein VK427_25810, partial [Kofleriaceae bacterium]|nr:hypothetical protein [Kofleriaceae bacterium]